MPQVQKKHGPVYNRVSNQSLETENKKPQTQKKHEPVYDRVTNQKLRAKKTKFNALKFETGTVTVNAANVKPKL
jgi:hypothetical protein